MVYRLNLQEQGRAAATEAIMPKLWILYYVLLVFSMSLRIRPIGRVIRLSFIPFSTGIRSLQCCCRGSVLAATLARCSSPLFAAPFLLSQFERAPALPPFRGFAEETRG